MSAASLPEVLAMKLPDFLTEGSDGELRVKDHRIGLLHLVHYYNEGYSPEMLVGQYPTLPLALIHKVIAFYLENQSQVDQYVASCLAELARQRLSSPRSVDFESLRLGLEAMRRAEAESA
jgi:uncharacterized protein (DUF433 family)